MESLEVPAGGVKDIDFITTLRGDQKAPVGLPHDLPKRHRVPAFPATQIEGIGARVIGMMAAQGPTAQATRMGNRHAVGHGPAGNPVALIVELEGGSDEAHRLAQALVLTADDGGIRLLAGVV
jgi:hypothetical protein